MEIYNIALALAKANRHPAPEEYAAAVERAAAGKDPWEVQEVPPAPQPAASQDAAATDKPLSDVTV